MLSQVSDFVVLTVFPDGQKGSGLAGSGEVGRDGMSVEPDNPHFQATLVTLVEDGERCALHHRDTLYVAETA